MKRDIKTNHWEDQSYCQRWEVIHFIFLIEIILEGAEYGCTLIQLQRIVTSWLCSLLTPKRSRKRSHISSINKTFTYTHGIHTSPWQIQREPAMWCCSCFCKNIAKHLYFMRLNFWDLVLFNLSFAYIYHCPFPFLIFYENLFFFFWCEHILLNLYKNKILANKRWAILPFIQVA